MLNPPVFATGGAIFQDIKENPEHLYFWIPFFILILILSFFVKEKSIPRTYPKQFTKRLLILGSILIFAPLAILPFKVSVLTCFLSTVSVLSGMGFVIWSGIRFLIFRATKESKIVKSRIALDVKVKVADVPLIFEKLKAAGKDATFAVFAFIPPGRTSVKDAINIQFSIDKGRIGLDWVLIGVQNIRDRDNFAKFAGGAGYTVTEREMNRVKYLRIEDGDLPKLCESVIDHLYAMPPEAELILILQGFTWP
jgi:hypothetical protein